MKKQIQTLAIIVVLICSLHFYLSFSQSNQNQASSKHESPKLANVLTKKENSTYPKPIQKEIISVAKTTIPFTNPNAINQPQLELENPGVTTQSEVEVFEPLVAPETKVLEPTTNTEINTKMPENSEDITNEKTTVQLTADEASAAQTDPIVIDLSYQGNWKSLDGSRAITGTQYGFKFENSPVGWLNRYSKNEAGLVLGDTNYFTFYVRLTENDHLIIEKTDGTEFWEFARNYQ